MGTILWVICSLLLPSISGHGRMRAPPSRASMWRDGYPENGADYDDNQMFCGGFSVSSWVLNNTICLRKRRSEWFVWSGLSEWVRLTGVEMATMCWPSYKITVWLSSVALVSIDPKVFSVPCNQTLYYNLIICTII